MIIKDHFNPILRNVSRKTVAILLSFLLTIGAWQPVPAAFAAIPTTSPDASTPEQPAREAEESAQEDPSTPDQTELQANQLPQSIEEESLQLSRTELNRAQAREITEEDESKFNIPRDEHGNKFYKKIVVYTHPSSGAEIPIVGSEKVSDEAFSKALTVVGRMSAGLSDKLMTAMAANQNYISIIGAGETAADLPGVSSLPNPVTDPQDPAYFLSGVEYYRTVSREVLGATDQMPRTVAVSMANLLQSRETQDQGQLLAGKYYGLMMRSMDQTDAHFRSQMEAAYEKYKTEGLLNHSRWSASALQAGESAAAAFFNWMQCIENVICNASGMRAKYPDFFKLMEKLFAGEIGRARLISTNHSFTGYDNPENTLATLQFNAITTNLEPGQKAVLQYRRSGFFCNRPPCPGGNWSDPVDMISSGDSHSVSVPGLLVSGWPGDIGYGIGGQSGVIKYEYIVKIVDSTGRQISVSDAVNFSIAPPYKPMVISVYTTNAGYTTTTFDLKFADTQGAVVTFRYRKASAAPDDPWLEMQVPRSAVVPRPGDPDYDPLNPSSGRREENPNFLIGNPNGFFPSAPLQPGTKYDAVLDINGAQASQIYQFTTQSLFINTSANPLHDSAEIKASVAKIDPTQTIKVFYAKAPPAGSWTEPAWIEVSAQITPNGTDKFDIRAALSNLSVDTEYVFIVRAYQNIDGQPVLLEQSQPKKFRTELHAPVLDDASVDSLWSNYLQYVMPVIRRWPQAIGNLASHTITVGFSSALSGMIGHLINGLNIFNSALAGTRMQLANAGWDNTAATIFVSAISGNGGLSFGYYFAQGGGILMNTGLWSGDISNVFTHELGHTFGFNHAPSSFNGASNMTPVVYSGVSGYEVALLRMLYADGGRLADYAGEAEIRHYIRYYWNEILPPLASRTAAAGLVGGGAAMLRDASSETSSEDSNQVERSMDYFTVPQPPVADVNPNPTPEMIQEALEHDPHDCREHNHDHDALTRSYVPQPIPEQLRQLMDAADAEFQNSLSGLTPEESGEDDGSSKSADDEQKEQLPEEVICSYKESNPSAVTCREKAADEEGLNQGVLALFATEEMKNEIAARFGIQLTGAAYNGAVANDCALESGCGTIQFSYKPSAENPGPWQTAKSLEPVIDPSPTPSPKSSAENFSPIPSPSPTPTPSPVFVSYEFASYVNAGNELDLTGYSVNDSEVEKGFLTENGTILSLELKSGEKISIAIQPGGKLSQIIKGSGGEYAYALIQSDWEYTTFSFGRESASPEPPADPVIESTQALAPEPPATDAPPEESAGTRYQFYYCSGVQGQLNCGGPSKFEDLAPRFGISNGSAANTELMFQNGQDFSSMVSGIGAQPGDFQVPADARVIMFGSITDTVGRVDWIVAAPIAEGEASEDPAGEEIDPTDDAKNESAQDLNLNQVTSISQEDIDYYGLDANFYKKKLNTAAGIPIFSSINSPDEALFEAAKIVDKMTQGLPPAVRSQLVTARNRITVMGEWGTPQQEGMTDVPEYKIYSTIAPPGEVFVAGVDYSAWWDLRYSGGLGGTLGMPVTLFSTANLLKTKGDLYVDKATGMHECIGGHEFMHAIYFTALKVLDPVLKSEDNPQGLKFSQWLAKEFETAKAIPGFAGTYAGSNESEFIAEMAAAYLDAGMLDGGIKTQADLKAYLPGMHALLKALFEAPQNEEPAEPEAPSNSNENPSYTFTSGGSRMISLNEGILNLNDAAATATLFLSNQQIDFSNVIAITPLCWENSAACENQIGDRVEIGSYQDPDLSETVTYYGYPESEAEVEEPAAEEPTVEESAEESTPELSPELEVEESAKEESAEEPTPSPSAVETPEQPLLYHIIRENRYGTAGDGNANVTGTPLIADYLNVDEELPIEAQRRAARLEEEKAIVTAHHYPARIIPIGFDGEVFTYRLEASEPQPDPDATPSPSLSPSLTPEPESLPSEEPSPSPSAVEIPEPAIEEPAAEEPSPSPSAVEIPEPAIEEPAAEESPIEAIERSMQTRSRESVEWVGALIAQNFVDLDGDGIFSPREWNVLSRVFDEFFAIGPENFDWNLRQTFSLLWGANGQLRDYANAVDPAARLTALDSLWGIRRSSWIGTSIQNSSLSFLARQTRQLSLTPVDAGSPGYTRQYNVSLAEYITAAKKENCTSCFADIRDILLKKLDVTAFQGVSGDQLAQMKNMAAFFWDNLKVALNYDAAVTMTNAAKHLAYLHQVYNFLQTGSAMFPVGLSLFQIRTEAPGIDAGTGFGLDGIIALTTLPVPSAHNGFPDLYTFVHELVHSFDYALGLPSSSPFFNALHQTCGYSDGCSVSPYSDSFNRMEGFAETVAYFWQNAAQLLWNALSLSVNQSKPVLLEKILYSERILPHSSGSLRTPAIDWQTGIVTMGALSVERGQNDRIEKIKNFNGYDFTIQYDASGRISHVMTSGIGGGGRRSPESEEPVAAIPSFVPPAGETARQGNSNSNSRVPGGAASVPSNIFVSNSEDNAALQKVKNSVERGEEVIPLLNSSLPEAAVDHANSPSSLLSENAHSFIKNFEDMTFSEQKANLQILDVNELLAVYKQLMGLGSVDTELLVMISGLIADRQSQNSAAPDELPQAEDLALHLQDPGFVKTKNDQSYTDLVYSLLQQAPPAAPEVKSENK